MQVAYPMQMPQMPAVAYPPASMQLPPIGSTVMQPAQVSAPCDTPVQAPVLPQAVPQPVYPAQVGPVATQLVPQPQVVAPASHTPCSKQDGQIVVGGAAKAESFEMREAEQEVETFEKLVVQAERQAGLPDTIRTSTTPYNVDLVSREEREEFDGIMVVIFVVSAMGIGGVLYMLMQHNEPKKHGWEEQSEEQRQQSLQEQQRRLSAQRQPSQTTLHRSQGPPQQPPQQIVPQAAGIAPDAAEQSPQPIS